MLKKLRVSLFFTSLTFLCILTFFASQVHAQTVSWNNPSWGQSNLVQHGSLPSSSMGVDVGYTIYLPPSYENSQTRFPVVYFLHGVAGHEWNYLNSLGNNPDSIVQVLESGRVSDQMIIVFPNGGKGLNYIDAPGDCKNTKECPETMIISELIPYIDQNYRTIPEKEGRAIEGFSMGGMGSLYLGTKYPELFSSIVAQSAACQLIDNCDTVKSYVLANINSNASYLKSTMAFRLSYGALEGDPNSGKGIAGWQGSTQALLQSLGIPSQLVGITGIGHNLSDQQSFLESNLKTFSENNLIFHAANFSAGSGTLPPPPPPPPQPQPSPTSSIPLPSRSLSPTTAPTTIPPIFPTPTPASGGQDDPSPTRAKRGGGIRIGKPEVSASPDLNRDNQITREDFTLLMNSLFSEDCSVNLLGDCSVDLFDYNRFFTEFERARR